MSSLIEIEINEQKVTTPRDATIIEAADRAGIYIPRFCYHKKLSIAANCRMCLVEVAKSGKPLPACATPITEGMQIYTQSKKALAAQRAVMEFLLINHPLDCPICDQGGECELQDTSMGYGAGYSNYQSTKRSVIKEDLGPLIDTGMTRCIHCTRCVRFGDEIAGLRELGATGRGEDMQIGTYVKHFIKSEVSGNVIDLCPVGALTSKPFRYQARSWELQQFKSIAPHDCLGSNIYLHSRGHQYKKQRTVMRVVPREAECANQMWLSDRDRFAYQGLQHAERVQQPMIKRKGKWQPIGWQAVLAEIAHRLQQIMRGSQEDALAALVSPQSSLEEMYYLQKMLRALGSNTIDYRYRQQDFSDQDQLPAAPISTLNFSDIDQAQKIFIIGSNIRHEVPLLGLRVRYAALAENAAAKVILLNSMDYPMHFSATQSIVRSYDAWQDYLQQVLHALLAKHTSASVPFKVADLPAISEAAQATADSLLLAGEGCLILGLEALHHPQAAGLRQLALAIAELSNCQLLQLTDGPNSAGAALSGCLPHRGVGGQATDKLGYDAQSMFSRPHQAYWLHGLEVEADCINPATALKALHEAGLVICCHSFLSEAMRQYADIFLPHTPWSDCAGTMLNLLGMEQSFGAATLPQAQEKPGWKIIRVLAQLLDLPGFEAKNHAEVKAQWREDMQVVQQQLRTIELSDALAATVAEQSVSDTQAKQIAVDTAAKDQARSAATHVLKVADRSMQRWVLKNPWGSVLSQPVVLDAQLEHKPSLQRMLTWPMYAVDGLVRRATALQQVSLSTSAQLMLSPATAATLQLQAGQRIQLEQGAQQIEATLAIDQRLADGMLWLPYATDLSLGFGSAPATIKLRGL